MKTIKVVDTSVDDGIIIKCMKKDPAKNEEEALKDIYRRLAARRSAHRRQCARADQAIVLRLQALRPGPRGSLQDQPEAWTEGQRFPHPDTGGSGGGDHATCCA